MLVAAELGSSRVGQTLEVLIEGKDEDGGYLGHRIHQVFITRRCCAKAQRQRVQQKAESTFAIRITHR